MARLNTTERRIVAAVHCPQCGRAAGIRCPEALHLERLEAYKRRPRTKPQGRPLGRRTVAVSSSVPIETKSELLRRAQRQGVSLGRMIRDILVAETEGRR